jgi:hypothetical protein
VFYLVFVLVGSVLAGFVIAAFVLLL